MSDEKTQPLDDSQILIAALIRQLRDLESAVEEKSRQSRDLQAELDRAERDQESTQDALRKILKPLVEERAALYLIHENETVRRIAKEILSYEMDNDNFKITFRKNR